MVTNLINAPEAAYAVFGVKGRLLARTTGPQSKPGCWLTQKWVSERRAIGGSLLSVTLRFDDDCGNGRNSFSITGTIYEQQRGKWRETGGGCGHEEIAQAFPELAQLIPWHLCSSDGPMHYGSNVMFLAGDRDCWGRRAGEPAGYEYGVRFGDSPITRRINKSFRDFLQQRLGTGDFSVAAIAHDNRPGEYVFPPHYTLTGYGEKWHEAPFRDRSMADEFCEALNRCAVSFVEVPTSYSEGKARELDAARSAAIWPEATDEELTAPDLKEALELRLPALLERFNAAMRACGFYLSPDEAQS